MKKQSTEYESLEKWSKSIRVPLMNRIEYIHIEGVDRNKDEPLKKDKTTYSLHWMRWNDHPLMLQTIGANEKGLLYDFWGWDGTDNTPRIWSGKDVRVKVEMKEPVMVFEPKGFRNRKAVQKKPKIHTMIDEICYQYNIKSYTGITLPIFYGYNGLLRWKKPTHPFFAW